MNLEPLTKISINVLNNSKLVKRNSTRRSKNDKKKMKFDLEKEQSAHPSEATQGDVPSDTSANAKAIVVDTFPMVEHSYSSPVDVPSNTAVNTKAKVVDTQNNVHQFTNVTDLDVSTTVNELEAEEAVRTLEMMREAIDQPVESVIEIKDCTDLPQEMQNQSELPPSQNVALTADVDIFQPQTSQQLHTQ